MRNWPQQKRSQEKIELALSCAHEILLADGIEAVSTTRVAEEAGMAIGSLYRYFKDRNELLAALATRTIADVLDEVAGNLDDFPASAGVEDICRRVISVFWDSVSKRPGYQILNRWQTAHLSARDITPGTDSKIGELGRQLMIRIGISDDRDDFLAIQQTALTMTSTLVDQVQEQTDDKYADQLKEELILALSAYLSSRV